MMHLLLFYLKFYRVMRNVSDNFQTLISHIYKHLPRKYSCMVAKQCITKRYEERSGWLSHFIGGLWPYFKGLEKSCSDKICVIKLIKISNLGPCIG